MLIREAQNQDIDQLMAIEELCYDHPWPREAFEEEIEQADIGAGIVAEDEGLLVGFLTGMMVAHEFHLHNMAVHPDFRGRGIGRELLAAVESMCREKDIVRILLEVREDNEIARHLYLSMGFESVGTRKDYYGPGRDAYLYSKRLKPESEPGS
ncbi:MAG: ribosomal protein S18-alanine N-acetyltransferase [Fidelibacterota bacterium]|nr:MAG: ribosomal protein S18-alanine N-acetyltransferase [Candidatus Neomarinimicrobiota bacterium]